MYNSISLCDDPSSLQIWPVCVTVPDRSLCSVAVQQCHCHPAVHDGTAAAPVHSLLWPNTTAAAAGYGPCSVATRGRPASLNTLHKGPSTDGKIVHCEALVVTQLSLCLPTKVCNVHMCHIGFLAYILCASKSRFLTLTYGCSLRNIIKPTELAHPQPKFLKAEIIHICGWPRKTFPRPACFKECRYGIINSKNGRYGIIQRKQLWLISKKAFCLLCVLVCGSLFHI